MSKVQHYLPNGRYSEAVVFNQIIYLSGQVPEVGETIEQQTQNVLLQVDQVLKANGSSKASLLSAMIHLSDLSDYVGMNQEWDRWLEGHAAPARTTVQAKLANPAWRVEITLTAAVE